MTERMTLERGAETGTLAIDFLYWEDCPSHDRALQLLQEVIAEEDVKAHITIRQVETEEEAEMLQFPGSPTIKVQGRDIAATDAPASLSCRTYIHPNGKISPLPSRETIAEALRKAE